MRKKLLSLAFLAISLSAQLSHANESLFLKCTKLEKNNSLQRVVLKPETKVVEITDSTNGQNSNIYDSAFAMWDATVIVSKLQERLFLSIAPKNSETESTLSLSLQQVRQPSPTTISVTSLSSKNKKSKTTISCVVLAE